MPRTATARLDIMEMSIRVPRQQLLSALRASWSTTAGPSELADGWIGPNLALAPASSGNHEIVVEWWHVQDGSFQIGGVDQEELAQRTASALLQIGEFFSPFRSTAAHLAKATQLQSRARQIQDTLRRRLGNYEEVAILVPNVQLGSSPGTRACLVMGMYTDSAFARLVDDTGGFGMHKRRATMEHRGEEEHVLRDETGRVAMHARVVADHGATRREPAHWRQPLIGGPVRGMPALCLFERNFGGACSAHLCELTSADAVLAPLLLHTSSNSCRVRAYRHRDVQVRLHAPVYGRTEYLAGRRD